MNKVAILLFGLAGSINNKGGIGEVVDLNFAYDGYLKSFNKYQVDFYIHTWSFELRDKIDNLYKPKKIIAEKKLPYNKNFWIDEIKKKNSFYLNLKKKLTNQINKDALMRFNSMSRWTSVKKSFELIPKNEIKNYDFILSARLDLEFFNEFTFPEELSENQLLVSHYNDSLSPDFKKQPNKKNHTFTRNAFLDFWFGGKPKTMEKFSNLISYFESYSHDSHICSYQHANFLSLTPYFKYYRYYDFEMVRRYRYKSII